MTKHEGQQSETVLLRFPKEDKFYREDNTTVEEAIPIRKTKDVMYDIKLVK